MSECGRKASVAKVPRGLLRPQLGPEQLSAKDKAAAAKILAAAREWVRARLSTRRCCDSHAAFHGGGRLTLPRKSQLAWELADAIV